MTYPLLSGLRVLEIGSMLSAPYCGKLLADAGARVVKLEAPDGSDVARRYGPWPGDIPHTERSGLFLYLNSNKEGITANLETPTGRSIMRRLVASSDVVVHNVPPADMERLGLDYDTLADDNPNLVMASISPWGLSGPWRDYKAYDINLAAAGGICEGLGEADREPLSFGTPEVGYFAGMAAASSIVMALLARETHGGQHIDIAEAETMAGLYNGPEALMAVYQWRVTRRTGHHALDFPYPNCILRCKDGHIFVGSPEGRQWGRLLQIMGSPEWSQEQRFRNRTAMNNLYADEVDGYVEAWLADYTKAELLEIALEHRIPLAPVRTYDEVHADPSLADLFVVIERDDTGPVAYPGPPYKLSDADVTPPSPAPTLGQHNRAVLCEELGFSLEELVKLHQTGII
ncbi:MAG: CoA transferase [Chloroflexota bacterium]|nr:CoA transferase [Chloroflexota bacterium]